MTTSGKRRDMAQEQRLRAVTNACKAAAQALVPHARVVLYGSQARGDATAESDIDILVLTPDEATPALRQALNDAMLDIELAHDVLVSCLVCSERDWNASPWRVAPLCANVEREGIAL